MRNPIPPRRGAAFALAALGLGAALALPASTAATAAAGTGPANSSRPTCTRATVTTAQAFLSAQVANRVAQVQQLSAGLTGARGKHLTDSDRAALSADLSQTLSGLQALEPQVQAATTCAALLADAATMVHSYWVYLLRTPQVDLTEVADTETDVSTRLQTLEPKVQAAIARAQRHGTDVAGAEQADSDLQAKVAAAASATSGVAATVLAQTPAGSPGNFSVLTSAQSSLATAGSDLQAAGTDLATIVADLT